MDAQRYETSLRLLKNISRVSAERTSEIFFNTQREISYLHAAT